VMAIFAILISSDSSNESVGTSTSWVILFGKIPTSIPATVPIVDLLVFHDDTPLIPIETLLFHLDTPERPSSQDPYKVIVSRWRSRVAACSSPPSPLALRQILPAPPGLPCRPAILVLPGQLIPVGRPCQSLSIRSFLLDDFSSDTSPGSSSGYSSYTSSDHSILDSSFDSPATSFAGLSHKRHRSPVVSVPLATPVPRALSLVRANLLLPHKRIRCSVSTTT
ncbi:hypothetical protein Tco_1119413, partial [Tanacetum coccineum]